MIRPSKTVEEVGAILLATVILMALPACGSYITWGPWWR